MTIEELSRGIEEGKWTCRDLALKCLKAVAENDSGGRKLNSVAEIKVMFSDVVGKKICDKEAVFIGI